MAPAALDQMYDSLSCRSHPEVQSSGSCPALGRSFREIFSRADFDNCAFVRLDKKGSNQSLGMPPYLNVWHCVIINAALVTWPPTFPHLTPIERSYLEGSKALPPSGEAV
jgi:hypothetical protein